MEVPLRRIARLAGMSHGHLSKVERGEHGRPVTPAIIKAYEKVTGVKLAEVAGQVSHSRDRNAGRGGGNSKGWNPGQLGDMRRKAYNAAIGALAVGGFLGEPVSRLIDSTGRPATPVVPDRLDIVQLEGVSELLVGLDMRYGGGLVSQLAKSVLRWAAPMLDAHGTNQDEQRRLHAVVGAIAHRAGWAAFDVQGHESARSLFRFALYAASVGEDHDLRGHVLADVAAQHNQLGYRRDALDLIRLGEGDERIAPAVRVVLHGVKARTYACLGEADACRRQVDAADAVFDRCRQGEPGWVGRLAHPARLFAITGHALADLADNTGNGNDRSDAADRLSKAVDQFDIEIHARARALCASRLAELRAGSSDPDEAASWTTWLREKLPPGQCIRSERLGGAAAVVIDSSEAT
jgi:transcriptional regulator with XRE-family HTH domain